jgi:hypothetical protein
MIGVKVLSSRIDTFVDNDIVTRFTTRTEEVVEITRTIRVVIFNQIFTTNQKENVTSILSYEKKKRKKVFERSTEKERVSNKLTKLRSLRGLREGREKEAKCV